MTSGAAGQRRAHAMRGGRALEIGRRGERRQEHRAAQSGAMTAKDCFADPDGQRSAPRLAEHYREQPDDALDPGLIDELHPRTWRSRLAPAHPLAFQNALRNPPAGKVAVRARDRVRRCSRQRSRVP